MSIRDLHNPGAASKAIEDFKKRFRRKGCMAPDTSTCSGKIVSAHTLSLEAMLRPISRNGHVYTYSLDLHRGPTGAPVDIRLTGIRETSTFNGFCEFHDKQIFAPIEDKSFAGLPNQVFLHAYRAVAKESFLKRAQVESSPSHQQIAEIHGLPAGSITEFGALMEIAQAVAAIGAAEMEALKSRLDQIYLANDWTRLVTTVIPFASIPAVIGNFVYAPDFDFAGNYLQQFEDHSKPLDHLMITVTPASTGGYAFLSHLDNVGTAPRSLIASLLRRPNLTSALIWLLMAQSENIAISPDWYESLSTELRSRLGSIVSVNADPMNETVSVLKECPEFIDDWKPLPVFSL